MTVYDEKTKEGEKGKNEKYGTRQEKFNNI